MKSIYSKSTLFIGSILALIILSPQLSSMFSTDNSSDEINDLRVRTAIYRAITGTIPNSVLSIHRTSPFTYEVPGLSSFTPQQLEEAMACEFDKQGLKTNIHLGLFNYEDDSLIYGNSIPYGELISSTTGTVHSDNGKLTIHLSKYEPQSIAGFEPWSWVLMVSTIFIVFIYTSRQTIIDYYHSHIKEFVVNRTAVNRTTKSTIQKIGNFKYDEKNLLLIHPSGKRQLTYKEGRLLSFFLNQPNILLERKQILNHVWEEDGFFVARSMDVFISRLRKYLAVESSIKIDNVRGVGYMLKC